MGGGPVVDLRRTWRRVIPLGVPSLYVLLGLLHPTANPQLGDENDLFIVLHIAQLVLIVGLGYVLWLLVGVGNRAAAGLAGRHHPRRDRPVHLIRQAVREALLDAVLVADRFHLIRLANDTVTAVRQRVILEDRHRTALEQHSGDSLQRFSTSRPASDSGRVRTAAASQARPSGRCTHLLAAASDTRPTVAALSIHAPSQTNASP